jgi:hypothetical protein
LAQQDRLAETVTAWKPCGQHCPGSLWLAVIDHALAKAVGRLRPALA